MRINYETMRAHYDSDTITINPQKLQTFLQTKYNGKKYQDVFQFLLTLLSGSIITFPPHVVHSNERTSYYNYAQNVFKHYPIAFVDGEPHLFKRKKMKYHKWELIQLGLNMPPNNRQLYLILPVYEDTKYIGKLEGILKAGITKVKQKAIQYPIIAPHIEVWAAEHRKANPVVQSHTTSKFKSPVCPVLTVMPLQQVFIDFTIIKQAGATYLYGLQVNSLHLSIIFTITLFLPHHAR